MQKIHFTRLRSIHILASLAISWMPIIYIYQTNWMDLADNNMIHFIVGFWVSISLVFALRFFFYKNQVKWGNDFVYIRLGAAFEKIVRYDDIQSVEKQHNLVNIHFKDQSDLTIDFQPFKEKYVIRFYDGLEKKQSEKKSI